MNKKFLSVTLIIFGILYNLFLSLMSLSLNYEYREVSKIKKALEKENKNLIVKYSSLSSPARIGKYAREKLGLIKPMEKQFRYLKK
jgi:cell division protein FtsL